jgi:hypothetical protein
LHHRQFAVRAGADNKLPAFPGYFFLDGQRRVSELLAEFLGGFLFALADFATINYDIVLLRAAFDLDGAERKFVETHTRTPFGTWLQSLFLDVVAEKADRAARRSCWRSAGTRYLFSCSVIAKIFEKVFLQPWQKNS